MKIKYLYIKLKDRILRTLPFIKEREMFYLNPETLSIIEPDDKYKNMTHREWFDYLGYKEIKDWERFTRGYYRDNKIKLFSGADHACSFIKDIDNSVLNAYKYFINKGYIINEIHIGNIHSTFRTITNKDWKPMYIVDMKRFIDNHEIKLIKIN